ncbi:MAG: hypothetical protein OJF49_003335 [Ktedonobacterales bacterium]|jgi:hypothetical protein|nr:MAG: hypothetical protein OJF49_003335 [Ktedonobacterales bacterium]
MSQTLPRRTLTEEVAEFLARGPSAEDIANFRISEQAQERVHALMEKNEASALTPEEDAELDEITVLDQLFTLIRAHRASQTHAHNGHGG